MRFHEIFNNIMHGNILKLGIPKGKEKEKGIINIFEELMTENFPNLKKETYIQEQEAQRVPKMKKTPTKTYHN